MIDHNFIEADCRERGRASDFKLFIKSKIQIRC